MSDGDDSRYNDPSYLPEREMASLGLPRVTTLPAILLVLVAVGAGGILVAVTKSGAGDINLSQIQERRESWYEGRARGIEFPPIPRPQKRQPKEVVREKPVVVLKNPRPVDPFYKERLGGRLQIMFEQDGRRGEGGSDEATYSAPLQDSPAAESVLVAPVSPYEVKAGTSILGILDVGIDSDLPGHIVGHVSQDVYDTVTGNYILIPAGTRIVGNYEHAIAQGQSRVMVNWKRLIFPSGHSLDMGTMYGADRQGYTGFRDLVDEHIFERYSGAVLLSIITGGVQLSQPSRAYYERPGIGQEMAGSLGTNLGNLSTELVRQNLGRKPTINIRPGYRFSVVVTRDLPFPCPWSGSGFACI